MTTAPKLEPPLRCPSCGKELWPDDRAAPSAGLREALEKAAINYVRCSTDPTLSPYIKENGLYGTKSPWRELVDAVAALTLSKEGGGAPSFQPTHRHYKGGLYQVTCRAELEANLRPVVVYRDADGRTWVRDSIEFFGTIEDGRLRFEAVKADG